MPKTHFDRDVFEAYLLGRMSQADVDALEEHILLCSQCQEELKGEAEILDAVVKALQLSATGEVAYSASIPECTS